MKKTDTERQNTTWFLYSEHMCICVYVGWGAGHKTRPGITEKEEEILEE